MEFQHEKEAREKAAEKHRVESDKQTKIPCTLSYRYLLVCQPPYPANRFQRPCFVSAKISNLRGFTMYLIELIVSKNFIPLLKHPIVTCFVVLFAAVIFFELIIY